MTDPYRSRVRLDDRAPLDGRPLRALAVVHLYPPGHNAGAEVMLHTMLRDLVDHGWQVRVLATEYRGLPYVRDGIEVARAPIDRDMREQWSWCDVGITHLDATRRAMSWSRWGRPLVHIVHNHRQLAHHRVTPGRAALVVWNSEWIAGEHASWPGESIVVRPPVAVADYETKRAGRRGAITLLNLYQPKGSDVFWRLAERFHRRRFIGVLGAYGHQHVPRRVPRNVRLVRNTPDVREIYGQTRVLLVPSVYESWGRVAIEAAASGIPVIAHPTEGLRESLTSPTFGGCALFADRDNFGEWVEAVHALDDADTYELWSQRSRQRALELDAVRLDDLERWRSSLERLAVSVCAR